MSDVIAIGGGGGGGGAAAQAHSGGAGGRGGIAFAGVAPTGPNNSGSGANGISSNNPGTETPSPGGVGGNQPPGSAGGGGARQCNGTWCDGVAGLGGFGGPGGGQDAEVPQGTWAKGAGWLNADFYTQPGPTKYTQLNPQGPNTNVYIQVPGTGGGGMASTIGSKAQSPFWAPVCGEDSPPGSGLPGGLKGCGGGGGGGWGGGGAGGNSADPQTLANAGGGGGGGGSYAPDAAQCNPFGTGPQAEATNNGQGVVAVYFVMTKTCGVPPGSSSR